MKVTATLSVELNTECPKCEESFDLMEIDDPDQNQICWQAISSFVSNFGDRNFGIDFHCPHCEEPLVFDRIEY